MSGALFDGLEQVDVTPALTQDDARAIVEREAGARLGASRGPRLVLLPIEVRFALAYRVRVMSMSGLYVYFVDARTGTILRRYSDLQTQHAPRAGGAVPGEDPRAIFTQVGGGSAAGAVRAPRLSTFDMRGDLERTIAVVNGLATPAQSDLAAAGSRQADPAARDAQANAALTYDYLRERFGQPELEQRTGIVNLVHPMRRVVSGAVSSLRRLFATSAFYAGDGVVVFGDGLPDGELWEGRSWSHLSGALDIVAHELAHAVVASGSRLAYDGESGALNEGYADVFAAGVEFAFQPAGRGPRQADYSIGEDAIVPGGLRSLAQPVLSGLSDRIAESGRVTDVHALARVVGHVFYLAVEGGAPPASGVEVRGVGAAHREDIEKVFYRAFVLMLPSGATFADARLATEQSARDLFGAGSAAARAVAQAWTAVGVH
jgi:thermolysin